MRGDFLDIVLILLAAAFAVGGYRQGFIVGVLGCAGFLAGAAVGVIAAPHVAGSAAFIPARATGSFETPIAGKCSFIGTTRRSAHSTS